MRRVQILSLAALLGAGTGSLSAAQVKIAGNDMAINGESFFAFSTITSELTKLARADGVLGASESFHEIAVSGAVMTGILQQYKDCTPKPVYMITDGGGNDLMGSCGATPTADCAEIKSALGTVQQYFDAMKTSGTKKIIWMRYPDPYGSNWATLKANQDVYNPEVEKICKASVLPKCQWIDMRTTWAGHYAEYTSDGIHPIAAGSVATAAAFWKAIQDSNFFDLGSSTSLAQANSTPPSFQGQFVSNHSLYVSLRLDHATPVSLRMTTLSGRTVFNATAQASAGFKTASFPLGSMAPGLYHLDIRAGASSKRCAIMVP